MKQDEINLLLNSFFISQEELSKRSAINEFANSISSIIVDDFAQNYLLNNPYLSVYLAHTDGGMLLKKIKSFVAFVLTAPVDEDYIDRIHKIGFLHYSIRLDPAKVSYGFWAINQVLDKLALTNELAQENKALISKLLKFVEHVMNDGYYIEQDKHNKVRTNEIDNINVQNELYLGFNIHKENAKKIQLVSTEDSNLKNIDDINEDPRQCSFGVILDKLKQNKQYEYLLGDKSDEIDNIHNEWHKKFQRLKKSLSNNELQDTKTYQQDIQSLTDKLSVILDTTLKNSLEDGHIALQSSMKSMRKITKLFYNKDYKNIQNNKTVNTVLNAINTVVLSEFSWAIDSVEVQSTNSAQDDNLIKKTIRYQAEDIFISIRLKFDQDNSYLNEIIVLLLEVLELHFFVQERELSLISFADKAESVSKSKDLFLANMSHELRTPINAITGFSQILMIRKDTPDTVKKYVEKINIAGNNLLDLVNTILDFAKLESGKMQFKPSLCNISNVLNEIETLISPLAQKKNITLHMPNIISLNLYIDSTLFKQVLINLLTNAIKFTADSGDVSLNIIYNETNHNYRFEVKDTGIGLSEEEISNLFQAFSQIENVYQKEHKGTGLGLMICKNIVEDLHKGTIWVESKKGEGSIFFIEMPTPMIESHTYNVNKAPLDSKNILIVEDSEEYQKILIEHLKDTHNMTLTDTINRAKELISKNSYDFLILDFFLTDGISSEILQFMENENISIPSIVISAEDEIHISSSLSGSTNLECIINKNNIDQVCASIKGEVYIEKNI